MDFDDEKNLGANFEINEPIENAQYIELDALADAFESVEENADKEPPQPQAGYSEAPPKQPPPQMDMASFNVAIFGLVNVVGGIVASRTKTRPLEMPETKLLSDAVCEVLEQYDAGGVLSPKAAAWLGLGMAGLGIYGPRFKERGAPDGPINVTPMAEVGGDNGNG